MGLDLIGSSPEFLITAWYLKDAGDWENELLETKTPAKMTIMNEISLFI
jgi:hypothetical protein